VIRLTGTVTSHDGQTSAVEVGQGELAAWEIYALRNGLSIDTATGAPSQPATMIRFLGYAAAQRGKTRSDWPSFEDWDAQTASVDLDADPEATQAFPQVRSAG
jgi:hypothetical protein